MEPQADHPSLSVAEEQSLVTLLAEQAVERAVPEELPLFAETAEEYFRDPVGTLGAGRREEAVGFGLELALLTPYLLAVATPVVRKLASIVGEAVVDELKPSVAALVHRLLGTEAGKDQAAAAAAELTREQLRDLRGVAYERSIELGLEAPRAALLADSIVGGLAAR
jgi:hypothetical protein